MHQFIGDLITSGHSSKNQPDVLNAAWGVAAAAGAALGLKASSLEPLQVPRPAQDNRQAAQGKHTQPRTSQRKGETTERGEGGSSERRSCYLFFFFPKM